MKINNKILITEDKPNTTVVFFGNKQVGGIRKFHYSLSVDKIEKYCELYSMKDEGISLTQKEFAAELVKEGFSIIWNSKNDYVEGNIIPGSIHCGGDIEMIANPNIKMIW